MKNYDDNQIRILAYTLWEKAGCPEDKGRSFWHEAEHILRSTSSSNDLGSRVQRFSPALPPRHEDKKIQQAMTRVRDQLRKAKVSRPIEFDKRFAPRVFVQKGTIAVFGVDSDGAIFGGDAMDISMNGIRFHAPKKTVRTIDRVVCFPLNVRLNITQARVQRQSKTDVTAVIEAFEDTIKDWLQWIEWVELMANLDQKV